MFFLFGGRKKRSLTPAFPWAIAAIPEYFLLYRIESSSWSPRNSPVHTCGLRKRAYRAGNHYAKAACLERLSSGTAD